MVLCKNTDHIAVMKLYYSNILFIVPLNVFTVFTNVSSFGSHNCGGVFLMTHFYVFLLPYLQERRNR